MISRSVHLPYPPSTNRLWRYTKNGVYRTAKYVKYINDCKLLHMHPGPPLDAPVRMEILAHPPDKRRRDLDNLSKSLCDLAIHLRLIEDDHWIHELYMRWEREEITQGVLMTVSTLDVSPVEANT